MDQVQKFLHPFHPHPLIHHNKSDDKPYNHSFKNRDWFDETEWYWCRACTTKLVGPYISCEPCGFRLHERCAKQPIEINSHPFHPKHKLELYDYNLEQGNLKSVCGACLCPFYGFCYICEDDDCDFFLHRSCALSTMYQPSHRQPEKVYFKHASHVMILFFIRSGRSSVIESLDPIKTNFIADGVQS